MKTDALEAAYRNTTYRVFFPAGAVSLRIGEANEALAAWLLEERANTWAVLTAYNPGSEQLPAETNAECQSRLEILLLERGFEPFAGENVADDGAWQKEESCFVPGISLNDAMVLARQFGQNAMVWGEGGEALPHLVWLTDDETNDEKNRSL